MGVIPFMALLPIFFGKLMDLSVIRFQGVFGIAICMMVTAILYLVFVLDNPPAFNAMKGREGK
jgi:hypothetical protein